MFVVYNSKLLQIAIDIRDSNNEFFSGSWSASRVAEFQLERIRMTAKYVKEQSPFYQRHLAEFKPYFLENMSFDEFQKLPFTSKENLRSEMFDMLSKPLSSCCYFYETTGTTGSATPCPRDYVDVLHNNAALTSCFQTIFAESGTRHFVGVCGPTELHSFGDTLGDVCKNLGLAIAKFWAYSPLIGLKKSIHTLHDLGITALICTPGMALTMAKLAIELGYDPQRDFKLEVLMLTGELGSPAMMENIGELWGAKAYNCLYGSQEALIMGAVTRSGKMHTFPLSFYYEVIDPESNKPVEVVNGVQAGELVITTLFQGSKPLLRYRTGDFVRLREATPDDVFPSPVIEVLGRTRDALLLNGHTIQGYDLEQMLFSQVRKAIGYQIIISDEQGSDRLDFCLEMSSNDYADAEIKEAVRTTFMNHLGVESSVKFGEIGAIGSTGAMVSWKAARIVDNRSTHSVDGMAHVLADEKKAAERIAASRDHLYQIERGRT